MAFSQQKFREIVFQMLYSIDIGKSSEEPLIEYFSAELKLSKKFCAEAYIKAEKILHSLGQVDALIDENATSFDFDRIHTVEKNILRLAIFELIFEKETIPGKVAIAEALRLTKKFSTPEAISFVNAILDSIYQKKP